jgi:competence protein ComGE
MLLKNDGLILAELLLSLSSLLMVGLFFAPHVTHLNNQAKSLQVEKQAYQYLYEELQALSIEGQPSIGPHITANGVTYQIFMRPSHLIGQKEVCVKVEKNNFVSEETEICSLLE